MKNVKHPILFLFFVALSFIATTGAKAKDLNVIVTIKPLYSLVANVMGDRIKKNDVTLQLIIDGGLDPHIFRLKPSDIRSIHNSDVLFYIDPNMEIFLKNILKTDHQNFKTVPLAQQKGIHLIPYRTSKIWYQDENAEKDQTPYEMQDLHIWLDPSNARRMVQVIEETLSALDPEHSLTYIQNAQKTIARLYNLEEEIREELRPLRDKPMIVYHDAFQYFEKSFGLKSVGAIVLKSDQNPSAKHIAILKEIAKEKEVTCVLAMPGAHPRIATVVMNGTEAGFGILDPLGLYLDKAPDLYSDMMKQMAKNIVDCQEAPDKLDDLHSTDK
ncbi:MAG: metal ABC transporter substrate-binding protein [Emcibacter sp.]|nr:metal ABC transporter substrate-binding protein [Emcibacter sp.]